MGKLKINILYDGKGIENYKNTIEEYGLFLYFKDWYHFNLIEQIEFQGEDSLLDIEIKGTETIDWTKFQIPEYVMEVITGILPYSQAKREIEILLRQIKSVNFNNRSELDTLGNKVLRIYSGLKLCDRIDNSMIHGIRGQELSHTLNKEVRAVERLRDKDAQYRKRNYLDDAIRHLESDISPMIHWLGDLKLNNKTI